MRRAGENSLKRAKEHETPRSEKEEVGDSFWGATPGLIPTYDHTARPHAGKHARTHARMHGTTRNDFLVGLTHPTSNVTPTASVLINWMRTSMHVINTEQSL